MKIGITCTLKSDAPLVPGLSDDAQEEFDSPETIDALAGVLRDLGHDVRVLGDGPALLPRLLEDPPELVFNLAEGYGISRSREARVPAVLEMLGIPYTGSDPLTLAVTLDKACAKRLVECERVHVPRGVVVSSAHGVAGQVAAVQLAYPVIAKPAWEGSSKGIRGNALVREANELPVVVAELLATQRQPVLIEEFITGDEITVGVVGNDPPRVLGALQVVPLQESEHFVYSLEVKRDWERRVRYQSPPALPTTMLRRIEEAALEVYHRLGCRDVARIDFRVGPRGPYFLEVNPLPGINPQTSDLVILARQVGWTYSRLIGTILDAALTRLAPQ